MGLFSFLKKAGSGALKSETKRLAEEKAKKARAKADKVMLLESLVTSMNLPIKGFHIDLSGSTVIAYGKTSSQAAKEKAILALGNVKGIAAVDDRIIMKKKAKQAIFHTVKKGESLSKIAKKYYGKPMKYIEIFKANQPMLNDPNRIYPGQVLRIPELKK